MAHRILVVGSSGLIGRALLAHLESPSVKPEGFDIRASGAATGDVADIGRVEEAVAGCDGIVHLAAVSRVVWCQRDPDRAWAVNVGGLTNVLRAAQRQAERPWLVFASSREVYGQADVFPVTEDTPLQPVNVYARSKVEGERLVCEAMRTGLRVAILRLSNVFGSRFDHADRVVPAFARAAVEGRPLRVEGVDSSFDFTHVDDVCMAVSAVAGHLQGGGESLPPINVVTGRPTTLGELAETTIRLARSRSVIRHEAPRAFDVSRFHGSPERARRLLGWSPRIPLAQGLETLIRSFRGEVIGTSR